MNNYCIYFHRNKVNNKVYIGQTNQTPTLRWRNGEGYKKCTLFYRAIQKYGWDNFDHIIFTTVLTAEEANQIERLLIALYNTTNPDYGYNIASGGGGHSCCHSEETKKKISANHYDVSGENNPMYGKQHSKETKKKISKSKSIPVYCVELDRIFESGKAAAEELHLNRGHISECCKNQQKTCGGYHWKYIEE